MKAKQIKCDLLTDINAKIYENNEIYMNVAPNAGAT
jgi:hypothetical protein